MRDDSSVSEEKQADNLPSTRHSYLIFIPPGDWGWVEFTGKCQVAVQTLTLGEYRFSGDKLLTFSQNNIDKCDMHWQTNNSFEYDESQGTCWLIITEYN